MTATWTGLRTSEAATAAGLWRGCKRRSELVGDHKDKLSAVLRRPPLVGRSLGGTMAPSLLVLYGSYRSDRIGIRLAHFLVEAFVARSAQAELIDARAIGLPMLDRMYKEYPAGT